VVLASESADMELWYLVARKALAAAWLRRWLVVATAWGVCVLGWVGVFFVPETYESQARLYVDADAVLTPLLRGIAIDTTTANQLEILQKTLLSRPNLDKLISITSLNLAVSGPQQRERMVAFLGDGVKLTSEGRNLFTLRFRNVDPQLAHDVVAGLTNIFMEQATAANRTDMLNAQKFLREQIASYEKQLRGAEQRRAEFRAKYLDILPLESNGGVSRLDSARVSVRELEAQQNDAVMKRDALKQEASLTSPVIMYGPGPSAPGGPNEALANAEFKLAELRTRLTDDNPDVIAAKRLVELIRAAPRRPAQGVLPTSNPGSGLANPVYEQIKIRLIEAEATISSITARLQSARNELARMEGLARAAPQVQAESENLDRDYDVLRKNYEQLLASLETSNITAAADNGADKVRLRVVDPPQVPVLPVAPNRFLLISLVLLGGLGAAVGLSVFLSQMDRSLSDLGHLRHLGVPVLGGISRLEDAPERPRAYGPQIGIAASIVLLLVVYGGLVGKLVLSHRIVI
jgi:polysaccharide chain length determinant protein (PEP-CTERM system associated)